MQTSGCTNPPYGAPRKKISTFLSLTRALTRRATTLLLSNNTPTEEHVMAAHIETVRMPRSSRSDLIRYVKAPAGALRRWAERGQIGASYSHDVRRATGAR